MSASPKFMFDVEKIREDFPILKEKLEGKPLVYLDNAATTHKPRAVIDALSDFYSRFNANIHRSGHGLGNEATEAYERTRSHLASFLGAASEREILFTRNATEALNLVASSWGRANLKPGDEVLVTEMEHHANLVPWQMVCDATGAKLKAVPILGDGTLDLTAVDRMLGSRTKVFAFTWASNVLGTINPVKMLAEKAHRVGALVVLDGAQAVPHLKTRVAELGCDFLAFSGHKMLGPTGIGVLWGRQVLLEAMPPYQGGGSMIETVTLEKSTWNLAPWKFEAGTPDIGSVVAFDAALTYLEKVGLDTIHAREDELLRAALARLSKLDGFTLYGPPDPAKRVAVLAFNLKGVHSQDVGQLLDSMGIAIRTGKLCVHPLMTRFKVEGMVRASFAFYNTLEEVEVLGKALERVRKIAAV
jgi:cysteine desulfurase/selenocysteine lyase